MPEKFHWKFPLSFEQACLGALKKASLYILVLPFYHNYPGTVHSRPCNQHQQQQNPYIQASFDP